MQSEDNFPMQLVVIGYPYIRLIFLFIVIQGIISIICSINVIFFQYYQVITIKNTRKNVRKKHEQKDGFQASDTDVFVCKKGLIFYNVWA